MKKLPLILFAAVGILIFAASCNDNDNNVNPNQGFFLLSNVSPDAPTLNVNINGSPFATGLNYGGYSGYTQAPAGAYTFDFFSSASTPVLSSTVNIAANKVYSFFVIDSFSKVKAAVVEDNLFSTTSDSVYVRFFNFSPNAGPLTLYDSAGGSALYSTRTFNDQAGNSNLANFNRILAGIYTLQLKQPDGTVVGRRVDTLLGTHTYSIFAKGFKDGTAPKDLGIGQIQHL